MYRKNTVPPPGRSLIAAQVERATWADHVGENGVVIRSRRLFAAMAVLAVAGSLLTIGSGVVEARIDGPASGTAVARRLSTTVPPGQPERCRPAAAGSARRHIATRSRGRDRHTGELHLPCGRRRGRRRRRHHVRLRPQPAHDRDERDRQGRQHVQRRRARRRRQGDPQRCRPAPHPVHEHLRPGADLDDLALSEPGPTAADDPADALHRRQQHRRPHRGRRRRSRVRPRRPTARCSRACSPRTGATRPGPTSAAARCGCSASTRADR